MTSTAQPWEVISTVRELIEGRALSKRKKAITRRPKEGLVLDCSIVMAWYFVDESDAYADLVTRQISDQSHSYR